jgi:hypothetical protein
MAIAGDERDAALLASRVQHVEQAEERVRLQAWAALHADRIADAAQELDMRRAFEARAVADPQHVCRGVVPAAGQAVLPGQRLLIGQQQRLVAGVEAGGLQLRHGLGIDAAGLHEIECLADPVRHLREFLRPGAAAHIIERPAVHLVQVGIAALSEGAQQVERGGGLVVRLHHALRVRLAAFRRERDVVDDVAAIARQLLLADRLGRRGARLGELARHAADLHDRQLGGEGQHHRHLEQHAEGVADVVGVKLGKALGAVAALQQECLAALHGGQILSQRARFAREHQRGIARQLLLRCGKRRRIVIGGHLQPFMAAPAFRLPVRHRHLSCSCFRAAPAHPKRQSRRTVPMGIAPRNGKSLRTGKTMPRVAATPFGLLHPP